MRSQPCQTSWSKSGTGRLPVESQGGPDRAMVHCTSPVHRGLGVMLALSRQVRQYHHLASNKGWQRPRRRTGAFRAVAKPWVWHGHPVHLPWPPCCQPQGSFCLRKALRPVPPSRAHSHLSQPTSTGMSFLGCSDRATPPQPLNTTQACLFESKLDSKLESSALFESELACDLL